MPKLLAPGDAPLTLRFESKNPITKPFLWILARLIEFMFGFRKARKFYKITQDLAKSGDASFFERSLQAMNVTWEVKPEELANIPAEGAVVTVSNHPFGTLEGLVLAGILRSQRTDMKVMANQFLTRFPGAADELFAVDVFGGEDATRSNVRALKDTMGWLKQGHVMGVFPSGEVSRFSIRTQRVADKAWSPMIGRIIQKTEATVVPIYFDGSNGFLFHLMGFIHPKIQTLMLPRIFLNQAGRKLKVRIGKPIPFERLKGIEDTERLMASLRLRTYMLKGESGILPEDQESVNSSQQPQKLKPLIERDSSESLQEEIDGLPDECKLHDDGKMIVFCASHGQIPRIMRELGRLRELTFRQVQEGTGNETDVDRFDETYRHLFLWHKADLEVVGAYRLGPTDTILPEGGVDGLYTSTLFKYKRKLIEQINPALELGRSFVQPKYQRSYSPLMLLWKGIGLYMGQNPRYRYMFGPVSISNEYLTTSKQLMLAFLEETSTAAALAKMLKARTPPTFPKLKSWELKAASKVVQSIEDVSQLISEVEKDAKGVPILIKQYLKLGSTLLAMNVDPDFGDCLDGLMLCDLTKTDPRVLRRYMGQELADNFLEYNRKRDEEQGAGGRKRLGKPGKKRELIGAK